MQFIDHDRYRNDLGSTPTETAQRNLAGRTHYADPDTLRFFGSRILDCEAVQHGHLLALVESLQGGDGRRVYRPAVFDRFGEPVHRPEIDNSARNPETARRWLAAVLESLDGPAITAQAARQYADTIRRHTARELEDLEQLAADTEPNPTA